MVGLCGKSMTDLGTGEAASINDVGQIVASGSNTRGQEHAFLLTAS
jgi:uncharacterized membrane protein